MTLQESRGHRFLGETLCLIGQALFHLRLVHLQEMEGRSRGPVAQKVAIPTIAREIEQNQSCIDLVLSA